MILLLGLLTSFLSVGSRADVTLCLFLTLAMLMEVGMQNDSLDGRSCRFELMAAMVKNRTGSCS